MKIKQMLYDWRRCLSLAGAAAAVLFSTSCKDDPTEDVLPRSSAVSFEPSVGADDWNTMPQTRSGGEGFPVDTTYVIEVPDAAPEGGPLYLHVAVADGIESAGAERLAAEAPQTRGAQITGSNFYDSFGVCALCYKKFMATAPFNLMENLKVEKSTNWATGVRWPGSLNAVFYAYAPYADATAENFTISNVRKNPAEEGVSLDLRQDPGITAAQSSDLLVAGSGEVLPTGGTAVSMRFRHAMAAIKFKADPLNFDSGSLDALGIQNIQLDGTLSFRAGDNTTKWSNLGGRNTVWLHKGGSHLVGPGDDLVPEGHTYFAIPQELSNSDDPAKQPQLSVTFTANGVTKTAELPLAATGSWTVGKTYTYTLSRSADKPNPGWDYTFEVNDGKNEVNLQYHQQSIDIPVKSFGKPKDGSGAQQAVGWKYEYSTDGGKSWIASTTGTVNGILGTFTLSMSAPVSGSNGTNHKLGTLAAYEAKTWANEEDNLLKKANSPSANSQMPYDLSTLSPHVADNDVNSTKRTTSNCYIVNGYGYFKIPVVYGNALKKGAANTSAYQMTGSYNTTECQTPWINHGDQGITKPWIVDMLGSEMSSAGVLWQDAQNLVKNVQLSSDKRFITFFVDQNTIKQGNAVISLWNNANQIMWSWHIWVTPYTGKAINGNNIFADRVLTNAAGANFTMMGMPVGHCTGDSQNWEEKSIMLRLTQNGTETQKTLTLKRRSFRRRKAGNTPLYQWGRPTPLPAGIYDETKDLKEVNDSKQMFGKYTQIYGYNGQTIATYLAIQRPYNIYYKVNGSGSSAYSSWTTNTRRNYWDMANRSNDNNNGHGWATKSIYDPSPRGYVMPTRNTFSAFLKGQGVTQSVTTNNNFSAWNATIKNSKDYFDEYGIHFRIKHEYASDFETLFLPSTGYRNSGYSNNINQSIYGVANMGCYWTATYMTNGAQPHRANALIFKVDREGNAEIYTQRPDSASDCLAVIAVEEW